MGRHDALASLVPGTFSPIHDDHVSRRSSGVIVMKRSSGIWADGRGHRESGTREEEPVVFGLRYGFLFSVGPHHAVRSPGPRGMSGHFHLAEPRDTLAENRSIRTNGFGGFCRVASLLLFLAVLFASNASGLATEPPAKKSTALSGDFDVLAKEIKRQVAELGYSDKVAQGFVEMVRDWDLAAAKQKLTQAREGRQGGKASKEDVVLAEKEAAKTLIWRVREKIGSSWEVFDLAEVVKVRKATCFGNSQLFWVLGTSLGLPVKAIVVLEPARGCYSGGITHAACLVDMADGRTIMADATGFGSYLAELFGTDCVSPPFVFKEAFGLTGHYGEYEIKDKTNPLGLHRRIRVMDTGGLHALLDCCRGVVDGRRGDYDKSIVELTEAIRLSPKWPEVYCDRGWAYESKGEYDKALADCTEAIRLDRKLADAYQRRGTVYEEKGDCEKAIADYAKAIRLDPKDGTAYYGRARAYVIKGDYDKAIADCSEAIRLDPKNALARTGRAGAYVSKGDYEKAIADSTEALRLDAKCVWAYCDRGWAFGAKGEYDQAIADYTEAIRLDANFVPAYGNRGSAYGSKGEYDKAIADYTEVIRLDAKSAGAYTGRGSAHFGKGDLDKAIADYVEAIRLSPKSAETHLERGYVYEMNRDFEKAVADYTETVRLDPQSLDAHNALAWLLATCPEPAVRDGRRALDHAQKAVALAKDANTLDTLAAAWAECGDFEAASRWQSKAIELEPSADQLEEFQERLGLYEERTPYREEPKVGE